MPERSPFFSQCGRVLLHVFTKGNKDVDGMVETVRAARKRTLEIIRDFTLAAENDSSVALAKNVMDVLKDLHPERDFSSLEQMIRELANICVTLRAVEEDADIEREKVLEAKIFCDHMVDELNSLR